MENAMLKSLSIYNKLHAYSNISTNYILPNIIINYYINHSIKEKILYTIRNRLSVLQITGVNKYI